ncbi:MAG TPA: hypothetical protein VNE39_09725 [Planctomycetota bacterium]|nr:hypothetical protein [Planctomycetota bacterium]
MGLIVVLVLMAVTATYVFTNAAALHRLKSYLDLVERQHRARHATPPPARP